MKHGYIDGQDDATFAGIVGIGKTPTCPLDVEGAAATGLLVKFYDTGTSNGVDIVADDGTLYGQGDIASIYSTTNCSLGMGYNNPTDFVFGPNGATFNLAEGNYDLTVLSQAGSPMAFFDTSTGRIGLRTDAPVSTVHLAGDLTIGSNTTEAWTSVGLQVTDIAGSVTLHDDLTAISSICGVFGKRDGAGFDGNILLAGTRTSYTAINCRLYFGGYDDNFTGTSKTGITASISGRGQGVDPDSGGYLDLNVSTDGLTETLALRCDNAANVVVANDLSVTGSAGVGIATPASTLHVYENTTVTGAAAGLTIEQEGTGDAVLQWLLTGGQRWVAGIDNTDDAYKIASNADVGTNTVLTLETGGNVVATNSLGIGATPKYPVHITADGATQDISPTINRQSDVALQLEAASDAEDMHIAIIGRRAAAEGTNNRNSGVILGNYNETTTHWLGQIYGQVENTVDHDGTFNVDVFTGGLETGRLNALKLADNGTVFFPQLGEVTASLLDVQYNSSTGELGYITSSLRYKENIREEVDSAWLLDLDVVTYDRKDGSSKDEVGIIAEQIAEMRPQYAVYNSESNVESYSKLSLIPLLLKEVQKLAARIKELESK